MPKYSQIVDPNTTISVLSICNLLSSFNNLLKSLSKLTPLELYK